MSELSDIDISFKIMLERLDRIERYLTYSVAVIIGLLFFILFRLS